MTHRERAIAVLRKQISRCATKEELIRASDLLRFAAELIRDGGTADDLERLEKAAYEMSREPRFHEVSS